MRSIRRTAPVAAALLALSALPARADDASDLSAKVNAAMSKVSSFQVVTTLPAGAMVMVVDRANKTTKSMVSAGSMTIDGYTSGTTAWSRVNGGAWRGVAVRKAQVDAMLVAVAGARVTPLPDRIEDGATVGAAEVTAQPPAGVQGPASGDVTMTCSYDKATYLLRTCRFAPPQMPSMQIVVTYTKYNDPANAFTLPADLPSPAPLPTASAGAK